MLKIFILEDSEIHTALLEAKLKHIKIPHQVVACSGNIADAIKMIALYQPNVLILDIDLGAETSFTLFQTIDYKQYEIIFATAHEDYAVASFDVEAIGYLVKPVIASQLERFLLIAQQNIFQSGRPQEFLLPSTAAGTPVQGVQNVISIPIEAGFDIVQWGNIVRCEAIKLCTHIFFLSEKSLVSSYNIGKFYAVLRDKGFYHPHRSHILNLNHVKRYYRSGYILMSDGVEIPVAKNKRQEFTQLFASNR